MPLDVDDAIDFRRKCPHFRILVIGRRNAGKTTLLKKVCESIEDPEIFSPSGEKISLATVEGSAEVGEHDINNALIFKSNRGFIFHDSRGLESGSADELNKVAEFISKRAASTNLAEQLHAIWYCLPTDTPRTFLEADEMFFGIKSPIKSPAVVTNKEIRITGKVPVIAIFTKFDGLITEARTELRDDGATWAAAIQGAPEQAKTRLAGFQNRLMLAGSAPSECVQLDDMRAKTSDCKELIEKTVSVLSDDRLKVLFISVQQNNIDLCIRYALEMAVGGRGLGAIVQRTLLFFPHVWRNEEYDRLLFDKRDKFDDVFCNNVRACISTLETKHPHAIQDLHTVSGALEFGADICICAEQTFTDAAAKTTAFVPAFSAALNAYLGSALQADVKREIAGLSSDGDKRVDDIMEIIKSHRLRVSAAAKV